MKKPVVLRSIIIGIILLIGSALAITGIIYVKDNLDNARTTQVVQDGNITVTEQESTIASIAKTVSPSVVSIITEVLGESYYGTTSQEGAGTGIVVSKDGYIMTNNHVIESASDVSIVDSNGELYENVKIVGRDPLNDIAFLKITSNNTFQPAVLGNSATVSTGQQVVAIGNALGQYNNTVTSGIISGSGRPITAQTASGQTESLTDLLQTDASINPGNSGGPLLNMSGQVIGINTAIAAEANGIGFAIPINAAKGMLAGVLEDGEVSRAFMGVNYLSITPQVAREFKLPVQNGAFVHASNANAIATNGPAAKAGLKNDDIIRKIDTYTVGEQGGLSSIIGQYRPGDTVTITYLRDNKEQTTELTFGAYSN